MSYNYTTICKNNITEIHFVGKFRVKPDNKYSYRKAIGANGESLFIVDDSNDNRCCFNIEEFNRYFFTDQELRREKIKRLNNYEQ